jgi:carbon storage regulator CsrA
VLILSRFLNESIEIRAGEYVIKLMITEVREDGRVKIGFDADKSVTIHRKEIQDRVDAGLPADTPKPIRTWEAK